MNISTLRVRYVQNRWSRGSVSLILPTYSDACAPELESLPQFIQPTRGQRKDYGAFDTQSFLLSRDPNEPAYYSCPKAENSCAQITEAFLILVLTLLAMSAFYSAWHGAELQRQRPSC